MVFSRNYAKAGLLMWTVQGCAKKLNEINKLNNADKKYSSTWVQISPLKKCAGFVQGFLGFVPVWCERKENGKRKSKEKGREREKEKEKVKEVRGKKILREKRVEDGLHSLEVIRLRALASTQG